MTGRNITGPPSRAAPRALRCIWPLTFRLQNKWVSRTHRGTCLCQVRWSWLHRLLTYHVEKQTNRDTDKRKSNRTSATTVSVVIKNSRQTLNMSVSHLVKYLTPFSLALAKCQSFRPPLDKLKANTANRPILLILPHMAQYEVDYYKIQDRI